MIINDDETSIGFVQHRINEGHSHGATANDQIVGLNFFHDESPRLNQVYFASDRRGSGVVLQDFSHFCVASLKPLQLRRFPGSLNHCFLRAIDS